MDTSAGARVRIRLLPAFVRSAVATGLLLSPCGCGQDIKGTYVGRASETIRTSAGEQEQARDGASVTIDVQSDDRVLVRYGDCELPGVMSPGGGSATLSQGSCPVHVADRVGDALMFGSVSRSGSRVSILVNGTFASEDERAVYRYRFDGDRSP